MTADTNFNTLRHLLDRLEDAHDNLGAAHERAAIAEREIERLRALPPISGADVVALVEMLALSGEGKKIEAIKLYRQLTGYGLKESKDAVERVTARFAPATTAAA